MLQTPTTPQEWEKIAEDFSVRWNFPQCLGAIDGKHVLINPPQKSGSFYYNYKGTNSIVLMAVVNSQYEFIFVDIGTNGRVSDGGVFSKTSFNKALVNGELNIPAPNSLVPGMKPLPFVFVADDAFALRPNIMKPFNFRELLRTRRIFNYRLSRARRIVENAFGILVSRFRIFQAAIPLHPDKVEVIVLACCALHNFLRRASNHYITSASIDVENTETVEVIPGSWHATQSNGLQNWAVSNSKNPSLDAKEVREQYCAYFNDQGKVPWQDRVVDR